MHYPQERTRPTAARVLFGGEHEIVKTAAADVVDRHPRPDHHGSASPDGALLIVAYGNF
jgi:hypothetical protein